MWDRGLSSNGTEILYKEVTARCQGWRFSGFVVGGATTGTDPKPVIEPGLRSTRNPPLVQRLQSKCRIQ